jgi:hypothetical protein
MGFSTTHPANLLYRRSHPIPQRNGSSVRQLGTLAAQSVLRGKRQRA